MLCSCARGNRTREQLSTRSSDIDEILRGLIQAFQLIVARDPAVIEIVVLSLRVSGIALLFSTLIGVPLGATLGLSRFIGRRLVVALLYTGMGFPPVVVGLFVYLMLSRSGPLGSLGWPSIPALFTPAAMVTAQSIISFPLVAGFTMAAVMADEQQAYTLSDRATYLARTLEGTDLQILAEGDPILFNPYGVMAVNPDKGEHIQVDLANTFIDWLILMETQEKTGQFGVAEFGAPLFAPDSAPWREAHPAAEAPEAEGSSGGIPADAALKIMGQVETEIGWTEDQLRAMETMEAESTNKAGETKAYPGVALNDLLGKAGIGEGASTLVFVADDGYTAEVALAEVQSCADCIVSFRNQGGFSTVLPGFPENVQVKGVIEIQVK